MAKIQIKSEKLTPFGGIFSIMEQFDALLAQTIDSQGGRIKMRSPPKVLTGNFRPSQLSFFLS